jgi:hypothetical protein
MTRSDEAVLAGGRRVADGIGHDIKRRIAGRTVSFDLASRPTDLAVLARPRTR